MTSFDEVILLTDEEREVLAESLEGSSLKDLLSQEEQKEMIETIGPVIKVLLLDDETFDKVVDVLEEKTYNTYNTPENKAALRKAVRLPGFDRTEAINSFTSILMGIAGSLEDSKNKLSTRKKDYIVRMIEMYMEAVDKAIIEGDMVTIATELISQDGRIPQFANEGDAGADLYSTVEMDLGPGEQAIIPLGFKVQIPEGYAMLIQPRSGQSAKTKLRICNTPGLIDSGYRGEVGVLVENIDPPIREIEADYIPDDGGYMKVRSFTYGQGIHIDKGQRIAQARIVQVPKTTYVQTDKVNETTRGEGGFGSSGKF